LNYRFTDYINKTVFRFLFFVKATALKQHILQILSAISRIEACYHICTSQLLVIFAFYILKIVSLSYYNCMTVIFSCTDFVCWRGLLTKLLCSPYENLEGWKIAVCRFRRTLYMCEFDTDEKLQDSRFDDKRQREMCYWGFKFETYITAGNKQLQSFEYACMIVHAGAIKKCKQT